MSGLTSCLAIYMKSLELDVEYVIEFFLPTCSADESNLQKLMITMKQHIKDASCMQLDIMSTPQVIGGPPFLNWDLEFQPLPITLLTEKGEVPHDSEDMEEDNMENEPSNSVDVGTSQLVPPYLEKEIENFDTNPGTLRKRRKRKRSESSITLEKSINILGRQWTKLRPFLMIYIEAHMQESWYTKVAI